MHFSSQMYYLISWTIDVQVTNQRISVTTQPIFMKYLKIFPLVILQNSYFQLKKICVRGWCEFLDDVCVPLKNTFLNKIKNYWLKYIYLLLGDATHLYINQNQKYCDYLYIRNHIQQIICPDYCQFLPKFIARFLL